MKKENKQRTPPVFAEWLLSKVKYRKRGDDTHLGDFEEMFNELCDESGFLKAWWWYWWHVINIVLICITSSITRSSSLFKNYLIISYRNLLKNRGYSLINISGLTIGLVTSILIMTYVHHEISYDKFHEHSEELYRVQVEWKNGELSNFTWHPLAEAMKSGFAEIEQSTRVEILDNVVVKKGSRSFIEKRCMQVDSDFLKMFSYPLVSGNRDTALQKHSSIVITEKMAEKYFGKENPLNKIVRIRLWDSEDNFRVTGVLKDLPGNTYFRFDSIVILKKSRRTDLWTWTSPFTFVKLKKDALPDSVVKQFPDFIKKHASGDNADTEIAFQKFTDIHLSGYKLRDFMGTNSDIRYIYIFAIIGILIIFIASFNYMNLAAARSASRSKEIGLRKVVGAGRGQLVRQFLGESVFNASVSLVFALIAAFALLPVFSSIVKSNLKADVIFSPEMMLYLLCLTFWVGLVSGSYPAVYLSAFKPVDVIKGQSGGGKSRSAGFRNLLVVIQFTITVGLIIGSIVIYMQLDFMQNSNPGYDKNNILSLVSMDRKLNRSNREFRNELLKHPGITNVTAGLDIPTTIRRNSATNQWQGYRGEEKLHSICFQIILIHSGINY